MDVRYTKILKYQKHTDFNPAWYGDVGTTILSVYIFNSMFPIIEIAYCKMLKVYMSLQDRGISICRKSAPKTQCKTIPQYYSVHSGPEYNIHYRYAALNTICSITFFYGPGIPILFPIGLFSLIATYIIERIMLAKYFRKPPSYSNSINYQCIRDILLSAYFYPIIGFWMFSN